MAVVALSSFSLCDLNAGVLSFAHLLSAFVLISMFYAIVIIRRSDRSTHFMAMIGCLIGALVAGILTLDPNHRISGLLFGN